MLVIPTALLMHLSFQCAVSCGKEDISFRLCVCSVQITIAVVVEIVVVVEILMLKIEDYSELCCFKKLRFSI